MLIDLLVDIFIILSTGVFAIFAVFLFIRLMFQGLLIAIPIVIPFMIFVGALYVFF